MNMLSNALLAPAAGFPAGAFLYRDVEAPSVEIEPEPPIEEVRPDESVRAAEEEIAEQIARAQRETAIAVEAELKGVFDHQLAKQSEMLRAAVDAFKDEQARYFARVESDVVHLALAIAAKILHRESQIDPLLVGTLVRIAVDKLHDGSKVTVRVSESEEPRWSDLFTNGANSSNVRVVADGHLALGDCVLETELGSAEFGIEAQLKEVEQGFFDLLAQRPAVR